MNNEANRLPMSDFAWEGPITPTVALGVLVGLAVFSAWLLWRERNVVGRGSALLFWLLRATISAVVLWMLLGPTNLVKLQNATSPGIAFLVDTSDSMQVVDQLSPQEIAPWNALSQSNPASILIVEGEQMMVAIQIALDRLRELSTVVNRQTDSPTVRRLSTGILHAYRRAVDHWETLGKHVPANPSELGTRGARIHDLLVRMQSEIVPAMRKLAGGPHESSLHDVTESVSSLEFDLAQIERQTQGWLRDIRAQQRDVVTDKNDANYNNGGSRGELVTMTMNAVEAKTLPQLDSSIPIHKFTFDENLVPKQDQDAWKQTNTDTPLTPGTAQGATDLAATLEQLDRYSSSHPLRTAILFSDGKHNVSTGQAPQDVADRFRDLNVYVVPSGTALLGRDVLIHRVKAPRLVTQGNSVVIESVISAISCDQESCEVVLKHNGNVVDQRKIAFVGDQVDEIVDFVVPAQQIGPQEFELSVLPLDEESSLDNNITTVSVAVVQDKVRLLIVDHSARWEFRYLEQLFRRDDRILCDTLLFSPEVVFSGDNDELTGLPTTVEGWSRYNVVILGDLDVRYFREASQRSLAAFVGEQGGSAIVIAGQSNLPTKYNRQPLLDLLPVQQHSKKLNHRLGVVPRITADGETNSALLIEDSLKDSKEAWSRAFASLPIHFVSEYSQAKVGAHTAMDIVPISELSGDQPSRDQGDESHAFLAWHHVGAGRVVYLSSPATWQLRNRRGDRLHHRFWGQMLRWVTGSDRSGTQRVRVLTDQAEYTAQDPIEVSVRLADDQGTPLPRMAVQIALEGKAGEVTNVDLTEDVKVSGRYVTTLRGLPPGKYRVSPRGSVVQQLQANGPKTEIPSTQFTVTEQIAKEMADTRCNRPLLEQIARLTRGRVVSPAAIPEILQLTAAEPDANPIISRTTLWNRWRYLWVIVGCLSTEWIVRKWKGLT